MYLKIGSALTQVVNSFPKACRSVKLINILFILLTLNPMQLVH